MHSHPFYVVVPFECNSPDFFESRLYIDAGEAEEYAQDAILGELNDDLSNVKRHFTADDIDCTQNGTTTIYSQRNCTLKMCLISCALED